MELTHGYLNVGQYPDDNKPASASTSEIFQVQGKPILQALLLPAFLSEMMGGGGSWLVQELGLLLNQVVTRKLAEVVVSLVMIEGWLCCPTFVSFGVFFCFLNSGCWMGVLLPCRPAYKLLK